MYIPQRRAPNGNSWDDVGWSKTLSGARSIANESVGAYWDIRVIVRDESGAETLAPASTMEEIAEEYYRDLYK